MQSSSFQGMARPRVVGMGDGARTGALPMISQDYSERYPLDGSQRVMQAAWRTCQGPTCQAARLAASPGTTDVQHPEYRHVCYELPRIAERLSLLMLQENALAPREPLPGRGAWLLRRRSHCPDQAFAPWSCRPCVCITRGRRAAGRPGRAGAGTVARRFEQLRYRRGAGTGPGAWMPMRWRSAWALPSAARAYVKRVCAKLGVQG